MLPWPAAGSFNLRVVPEGGDTVTVDVTDAVGTFSSVMFSGETSIHVVDEAPSTPRTHSVYFVNALGEEVMVRVYDEGGDLYTATLGTDEGGIFNVAYEQLESTVFVEAVASTDGVTEVVALDLPIGDFMLQTVIAPATAGKSGLLELNTYDQLGRSSPSRVVTSTEELTEVPDAFLVHQNYPNPFNPSTTIRYELSQRSDVTFTVVNVYGQVVRRLGFEQRSAGVHSVTWDGRNDSGTSVASGVYFYKISAGDLTQTRSMTLLR